MDVKVRANGKDVFVTLLADSDKEAGQATKEHVDVKILITKYLDNPDFDTDIDAPCNYIDSIELSNVLYALADKIKNEGESFALIKT